MPEPAETLSPSTHALFTRADSYAPIWSTVAYHVRTPDDLLNIALVSKAFHKVFTSDHVWRYYNVHSLESGILTRLSRDLRNRRLFKDPEQQDNWDAENEPTFVLVAALKDGAFPEMVPGSKLWWCFLHVARPWHINLPTSRTHALELMEWYPDARIGSLHVPHRDREFLVKLFRHKHLSMRPSTEQTVAPALEMFRDDTELMVLVVSRYPILARYAAPEFYRTSEYASMAVKQALLLKWAPIQLRDDFEYLLTVCNGREIRYPTREYGPLSLDDNDPAELQRKHTYYAIMYASPRIQSDPDLLERLLDTSPKHNLGRLAAEIDRKLAVKLWCNQMEKRGSTPIYMETTYFESEMRELVHTLPLVYKYAPARLQNDKEFLHSAIRGDILLLCYAPDHLLACEEIGQAANIQNPKLADYISGFGREC